MKLFKFVSNGSDEGKFLLQINLSAMEEDIPNEMPTRQDILIKAM